ncbi:PilC/PilY family type IV pilus protein [Pseudomonas sp.]|uniref:pilus assembly protein n=1 Tax=Pseudomonas sp. TaxID=306 RepID=UPI0028ACB51B|nr:PilC/PilY family type IV pilus protein [Pseudomonas sp.]
MKATRICQLALLLVLGALQVTRAGATVMSQTPLFVSNIAPPMNMLVVGRDQKLYYPAYNDASDIDGDGSLDIYYKPGIDYTGYFDSYKCYTYGSDGVFAPSSTTTTKKCTSATGRWSGDYLNYLTMSRLDVLRKVLYGGYRSTDSSTATVLERTFVPNDAHSWGKEYRSVDRDGYNIADYTPMSAPSGSNYILFANTSRPADGSNTTLTSYSSTALPKLRILNGTTYRIWQWVSRETPQATNTLGTPNYDLTVRVRACVSGLLESNCTAYGSNAKPTGILHDYGASDKMYFGLATGTYSNNLRGGVLRKAPATFSDEYTASTGRFITDATSGTNCLNSRCYVNASGIVANLDRVVYSAACSTGANDNPMTNGNCPDWGNPLGETAYETLRYYAGKTTPYSSYAAGSKDTALGLSSLSSWSNPYSTYPSCTKPYMTLVSDINPSYDSDVPGSSLGTDSKPTSDIGFDFSAIGTTLWNKEIGANASVNIGQSGTSNDSAPTAKTASSFATLRGLPEEPTRQGSYSAAAAAYFGSQNALTSAGSNMVQSFSIALSSTLPNLKIKTSRGTVTLVPFSMNVSLGVISQITGFYIDTLTNDSSGNLSSISFRVVYDDAAQGSDFDMDAIVLYTVTANSGGTVSVTAKTEYSVAAYESHMGYTIAGTGSPTDGVYLEVSGGGNANVKSVLDTPDGKNPGACSNTGNCANLPGLKNNSASSGRGDSHTRTFTPSSASAVTALQNPLWYAAKYGKSDLTTWDTDGDSVPDNYFLVSNPGELATQLKSAFDEILQLNNSVTQVAVDSLQDSTGSGSDVYNTSFDVTDWTGDLVKRRKVRSTSNGVTSTTSELVWRASAKLSGSGRNIKMAKNGALTNFLWANLSSTQQGYLNRTAAGVTDTLGQTRLAFVRGENSTFRSRSSLLGDIINSSPVLVTGADYLTARANALEGSSSYASYASTQDSYPDMLYVGANDGMLHAFNASTGAEVFAFVPTAVIPNLNRLTASDYGKEQGTEHQYFVDGTPVISDVYYGGSWHKVLVGSLGGGGRGMFALDITNPSSPSLLWELGSDTDSDMGYSVARPTIARLHNGKWVALVPNGYESGSAGAYKAVLFVVDIATGSVLKKLTATPTLTSADSPDSLGNGLSRLFVADVNGDGIADYAYGGDLLGNLWRFDLLNTAASAPLTASAAESTYAVAFGGQPLWVSRDASGVRQPITAAPNLVAHPSGTGYLVEFGTGRYLTTTDKTSTQKQAVYGIWDRKTAGQATTSSLSGAKVRSNLQQQSLTATTYSGSTAYTLTSNGITWYSGGTADANVNKWGWYMDFPVNGERLIYDMTLYGDGLVLSTVTPQTGSCSAGLSGTVYALDPQNGGATAYNVFDLNGDGTFESLAGFVTSGGDIILSGGYTYGNTGTLGVDSSSGIDTATGASTGRRTWTLQPAN